MAARHLHVVRHGAAEPGDDVPHVPGAAEAGHVPFDGEVDQLRLDLGLR